MTCHGADPCPTVCRQGVITRWYPSAAVIVTGTVIGTGHPATSQRSRIE